MCVGGDGEGQINPFVFHVKTDINYWGREIPLFEAGRPPDGLWHEAGQVPLFSSPVHFEIFFSKTMTRKALWSPRDSVYSIDIASVIIHRKHVINLHWYIWNTFTLKVRFLTVLFSFVMNFQVGNLSESFDDTQITCFWSTFVLPIPFSLSRADI